MNMNQSVKAEAKEHIKHCRSLTWGVNVNVVLKIFHNQRNCGTYFEQSMTDGSVYLLQVPK